MNNDKKQGKDFSDTLKEKEFSEAHARKEEIETNFLKYLKENGYTGDPNNNEEAVGFAMQKIFETLGENTKLKEELEKAKACPYHKQLLNTPIKDMLRTNTRNKKLVELEGRPDLLQITKLLVIEKDPDNNKDPKHKQKKRGDLKVATSHLANIGLAQLTRQIDYKGTNYDNEVVINIDNYLQKLLGYIPTNSYKKDFKKNVLLWGITLRGIIFIENKENTNNGKVYGIINSVETKLNNIIIIFNEKCVKDLQHDGFIGYYNEKLFLLKECDSNAHAMALSMSYHGYNLNNIINNNYKRLGVKTLLKDCNTFPTKEDLEKIKDRHFKTRIIEPFQKELNKLIGIDYMTWKYVSNTPLNEEQQAQLDCKNITDFELFEKLYIKFDLTDRLDLTKEIEGYKKKRETGKLARVKKLTQKSKRG